LDGAEISDEDVAEMAGEMDPRGELGIQSVNRLRNLTVEEFFGLYSGILRFVVDRPAENAALRWYVVDQAVGLMEPRSRKLRRMDIFNWGGAVVVENREGEELRMWYRLEGSDWKMSYYEFSGEEGKSRKARLSFDIIFDLTEDSNQFKFTTLQQARMAEGEQLLGGARNIARVGYAKHGDADGASTEFEAQIEEGYFDGEYYVVRNLHPELKASEYDAAIEAHPQTEGDGWGIIKFKWASGESEIIWYETRREMELELDKLSNSKDAEEE
jgi:hypothetical protein